MIVKILEKLEEHTGRLEKEAIITAEKGNDILRATFVASLDPWTDYGVRKFKMPPAAKRTDGSDAVIGGFIRMLREELAPRKVTGNEARDRVTSHFAKMNEDEQKWCERILLKNLRCGVQEKTVNKIWPGTIKPFTVQLAGVLKTTFKDEILTLEQEIKFPIRVEPKLDGLRLIAVKRKGIVTLLTRNGTVLETLPTIRKALEDCPIDNFVGDGEGMGRSWEQSASVLMSKKNAKNDADIVYNMFDVLTLEEWDAHLCNRPYSDRLDQLAEIVSSCKDGAPVQMVMGRLVESKKHGWDKILAIYTECLTQNFEGVMLKDLTATYKFKRSDAILKLKPEATEEGVIVGWFMGGKGTKRENDFGGFIFLLSNGVTSRVGSGFTDEQKATINNNPESYYGKVIEVKHQPPFTPAGCLRFPTLMRFRDKSDVDPLLFEAYEAYKAKNK